VRPTIVLSGDPSVSGSILRVVNARRALHDTLAGNPVWTDACERAAEDLARAMLAAGISRRRVASELRKAGLSRSGARQVLRAASRPHPDRSETDAEDETGHGQYDDRLICPHCARPIGRFDHFCPHCGGPVTAHASIDPLGQVYSAGHGYRRATSGRPTFLVLLGMWLIFGLQIPVLLFLAASVLSDIISPGYTYESGSDGTVALVSEGRLVDILKLLLVLGLLALYSAILWKVTARYRAGQGRADA
jgi:hypothetical protein